MCVCMHACVCDSRLAELDEVLVGGAGGKAADVQVGLAQLLRSAVAAAVGGGAGRGHRVRGWSIGLLQRQKRGGVSPTIRVIDAYIDAFGMLDQNPVGVTRAG